MNEFADAYNKKLIPGTPVQQYNREGGKRGVLLSRNDATGIVQWLAGGRDEVELDTIRVDTERRR